MVFSHPSINSSSVNGHSSRHLPPTERLQSVAPSVGRSPTIPSGQLVKAQLIPAQGDGDVQHVPTPGAFGFTTYRRVANPSVAPIEFQFNPAEISISRSVELNSALEGRTRSGVKKISFAGPAPIEIRIPEATFDTYESGENVKTKYTDKLMGALDFIPIQSETASYRPPLYIFTWGQTRYMRCFVKSLSLTFTMFLPDGTPVRAIAALTLHQVEPDGIHPAQPRSSP